MNYRKTFIQIKKLSTTLLFFTLCNICAPERTFFTIMLDPTGDNAYAGRRIEDSYERTLTLQIAQAAQQQIESLYRNVRVIITRVPGERSEPLQNASFANRLPADFYCSLNLFQAKKSNASLFIYFLQKSTDQQVAHKAQTLSFIPYYEAHQKTLPLTQQIAAEVHSALHQDYARYFTIHKPLGIPYAPFIGIQCPALCLEIGISKKDDGATAIAPLVTILEKAVTLIKAQKGWS